MPNFATFKSSEKDLNFVCAVNGKFILVYFKLLIPASVSATFPFDALSLHVESCIPNALFSGKYAWPCSLLFTSICTSANSSEGRIHPITEISNFFCKTG